MQLQNEKGENMPGQTALLAKTAEPSLTAKSKAPAAPGPAIPPQHVPVPHHDAVRNRAYLKWEAAGMPDGDGVNFWLEAERELLPRA